MTIWLAIVASMVVNTPSFWQNTQKIIKNTQTKLLDSVPSDIANFPIKWLDMHYPKEKTLELVHTYNLEQINIVRQQNGMKPLVLDLSLCQVAQHYAEEMNANQRCNHIWLDWSTPMKRANKEKYTASLMLENIGRNYYSITDALQHWKKSPWHFKNMIDPGVDKIWIWYANGYRVNMFAKRRENVDPYLDMFTSWQ